MLKKFKDLRKGDKVYLVEGIQIKEYAFGCSWSERFVSDKELALAMVTPPNHLFIRADDLESDISVPATFNGQFWSTDQEKAKKYLKDKMTVIQQRRCKQVKKLERQLFREKRNLSKMSSFLESLK